MHTRFLALIGTVVGIIGLLGLISVIFDVSLPLIPRIGEAYGPCAAVVFGWLMIVPYAYEHLPRKGYLTLVVVYVLTFLGIAILLSGKAPWSIVVLYAGLGALAFAARRSDSGSSEAAQTQACAADTLFGVTVILILSLAYYTVAGQTMTVGLIGSAFAKLFAALADLAKGWETVQDIAEFLIENLQVEYYIYAVASLFWLASDQTPAERFVPRQFAAYIVTILGIITLLGGLYLMFFESGGDIPTLFLRLCVCALGVAVAYLGVRRAS